ncbi:MAG TPA: hypothetical protein VHK28_01005 [Candidatus Limnocylindria bacterium]|nr:hypothetical protein [Candidatus Limnocylindria bacterium]
MTDTGWGGRLRRARRPRPWTVRRPPLLPIVLLLGVAAALLVGRVVDTGTVRLANPDLARVSEWRAALNGLPERPLVLVGMDPDLGTYPEIRAVTRSVLDELAADGARLAFVSFTPEGRAVAAAEMERLGGSLVLDAGFVAGAEAGLVLAVTDLPGTDASGSVADALREAGGGMAAFDAIVVVGGMDFGPRSWVEQVRTRLPDATILAVAPTFSHPELAPYLRTGQLDGLLATVRDGAAYSALVDGSLPSADDRDRPPDALAMLGGMLLALVFLGRALLGGVTAAAPADEPVDEGEA